MTDPIRLLNALSRPKLLIRAARFGLQDYRRERDLSRLLRRTRPPGPMESIPTLLEQERQLEATRKSGDAGYSIAQHIEVLIALMAEARLIPRGPDSAASG